MAAPIGRHEAALGKLVLQQSSFVSPKSKHELAAKRHYFNHSVGIVLPHSIKISADIDELCINEKSYLVPDLPIVSLIDPDLIEAFLKRGKLHLMSHGTKIDANDCVAVLPTGHLILHLSKATYVQLGLQGQPSKFNKSGTEKYVIEIDMKKKHFVPGRKFYDRVQWCLKDKLKMDCLVTWSPDDEELCSSSIEKYFKVKGFQCVPLPVTSHCHRLKDVDVPDLSQSKSTSHLPRELCINLFDWLGGVANNIVLSNMPDNYLSTYKYPDNMELADCSYQQYTGMLSSETVLQLLNKVRDFAKTSKAGWASLTVHGFIDSPVSYGNNEHGYLKSGDNLYTYVVFSDDTYWQYIATSTLDFIT